MVRKVLIIVTLYLKPWNWANLTIQPALIAAHSAFAGYWTKAQVSGRWERSYPRICQTRDHCLRELVPGVWEGGEWKWFPTGYEEPLQEQSFPWTGCEIKSSCQMTWDHLGICFRLEGIWKEKTKKILQHKNCLVSAQNDTFTVYGFICSEKMGKLYLIMFFPPLVFINSAQCNYKQHFSWFPLWNTLQLFSLKKKMYLLLLSKLSPWFALAFTKPLA